MARNDIPNGWDKIRQNVQETERLIGQKKYNQSMIKAKQTVEYMVKLQCEQAGIMEGSMDSMIRELYNNGWISKSTAEHYLQIYDIGTKAAKNGDNGAYNANQAYHVLSQEIYSFADNGKAPRGRRPASSRPQQSRNRSASRQTPVRDPFPAVKTSFRFRALRKWHPAHRPLKVCRPDRPRDHPDRPDPCPHAEETGYRGDLRTSDHNGSSRDHSPGD